MVELVPRSRRRPHPEQFIGGPFRLGAFGPQVSGRQVRTTQRWLLAPGWFSAGVSRSEDLWCGLVRSCSAFFENTDANYRSSVSVL